MIKLLSPVAVVLSLFLVLPVVQGAPDLPEDHPYVEEINYMAERGVFSNASEEAVRPDDLVTRAEAAEMAGIYIGIDGDPQKTAFSDVPKDHDASGYVAELVKAGYIQGYPDGTFRPDEPLTRGDMAVLLEGVFNLTFTFQNEFSDVEAGSAYAGAIPKVLAANITTGYPDGTFRPELAMTRGEFAAFLARGLVPEFRNDAVIEHSYQKDKTKTYTYQLADGSLEVHEFVEVPDYKALSYGFLWTATTGGETYEYMELENHDFFAIGYPYSEYDPALVYPIETGNIFETGYPGDQVTNTITGVGLKVETEYKTFTDAVEVTTETGFTYYLAEGYANIKSVDENGEVVFELVSVE